MSTEHGFIISGPGIMDILINVKYAQLDIPDMQENIPDDLRRSVCSKSESIATNTVTKEGVYYKISIQFSLYVCLRTTFSNNCA